MRGWTVAPLALALAACACSEPPAEAPKPAAAVAPAPAPAPAPSPAPAPAPALLTGTLPGDRLPAFTAKVRRAAGEGTLDLAAAKGTTVLVVMSTTCPYCAEAVEPLKRAEAAFQPRGVEFVYLYPMKAESAEEKTAWHAAKGFRAGQVIDGDAAVSRLLKADKTPTAFLVDARGVLLFRGAVVESAGDGGPAIHRLADALDEHLAGKTISVPSAEPAG